MWVTRGGRAWRFVPRGPSATGAQPGRSLQFRARFIFPQPFFKPEQDQRLFVRDCKTSSPGSAVGGGGDGRVGERPQGRAGEVPALAEPRRVGCWRRGEFALQIVSWARVPNDSAGAGP